MELTVDLFRCVGYKLYEVDCRLLAEDGVEVSHDSLEVFGVLEGRLGLYRFPSCRSC